MTEAEFSPGSYFFLSYAHSPPLAGSRTADPDPWVQQFFKDLTDAVEFHANAGSGLGPGFFDQAIPVGSDWKSELTKALGTAQVFVPLYSPRYLAMSWPGKEWAYFYQRLVQSGYPDPLRRISPVLWIPLLDGQTPPGLTDALALGAAEAPYAENGLCALLRLSPYRPAYRKVVDRLAGQIVSLAETVPVRAFAVPDIDDVVSPFLAEAVSATFTVTVAAPTLRQLPPGRNPRYYGEDSVSWRPFSQQQELSLADHVLGAAERLDFSVEIISISKAADQVDSGPGILLIDPWYIEDESNLNTLQALIRKLPGWVLPVVVHDSVPDPRAARLTAQITDILNAARLKRTESVRRAIEGIDSLQGFDSLLPVLVTEAERQYLRYGPFPRRAVSPPTRPRLSGHGVFPHQPPEEEPND